MLRLTDSLSQFKFSKISRLIRTIKQSSRKISQCCQEKNKSNSRLSLKMKEAVVVQIKSSKKGERKRIKESKWSIGANLKKSTIIRYFIDF